MASSNKSLTKMYEAIIAKGGPNGPITRSIVKAYEEGDAVDSSLEQPDQKKINIQFLTKNKKKIN